MVTRSEVLEIPTRIDAPRMPVKDVLAFVRRTFAEWLQRSRPADGDACLDQETDARQVFRRLAGCWTYWGWKGGYFSSEADARCCDSAANSSISLRGTFLYSATFSAVCPIAM